VSGRAWPIALIQPAAPRRDVDAAEEEHQEVREVRGEEEVLAAQADRAEQHPERRAGRAVARRRAQRRHDAQPGPEAEQTAPTANPNAETRRPFAKHGTPRPRKTAARFAGEASSGPSVPNQRSFATAIVIP
jgi:hypothetical protein